MRVPSKRRLNFYFLLVEFWTSKINLAEEALVQDGALYKSKYLIKAAKWPCAE